MATDPITLRGVITRLFHSSPTFSAGEMRPIKDDVTRVSAVRFAGKVYCKEGEAICLSGQWVDDPKWGRQFKADSRLYDQELNTDGLAAWLAVNLKGVGPVRAEKVAKEFGDNFGGILADNPEQIAIFAKVPLENVKALAEHYRDHKDKAAVSTKLAAWELTPAQIETLYERFRGSIVTLLQDDPYLLVEAVPGYGWKKVDAIARKTGVPEDHPGRIASGILHVLHEEKSEGSTACEHGRLVELSAELVAVSGKEMTETVTKSLAEMEEKGERIRTVKQGTESIWILHSLPSCYRSELLIAEFLRDAEDDNPNCERLFGAKEEEERDPFGDDEDEDENDPSTDDGFDDNGPDEDDYDDF